MNQNTATMIFTSFSWFLVVLLKCYQEDQWNDRRRDIRKTGRHRDRWTHLQRYKHASENVLASKTSPFSHARVHKKKAILFHVRDSYLALKNNWGRTYGLTDGRTHQRRDTPTDGRTDAPTDGRTDTLTDGRTDTTLIEMRSFDLKKKIYTHTHTHNLRGP